MGGLGSGNRWRWGARDTCEASLRVDIRFMRKAGLLRADTEGTLSWSRGGERTGWIRYRCCSNSIELIYRARPAGGDWIDIQERVAIETRDQPFGGTRSYFICKACQRRCMVLYGGLKFRCRTCSNLSYASQNEDATDRACSKARAIRKRLGYEGTFDDPFPPKPKGMHWRTYERLEKECESLESLVATEFDKLFGRLGVLR